jgi:hypothetical protein
MNERREEDEYEHGLRRAQDKAERKPGEHGKRKEKPSPCREHENVPRKEEPCEDHQHGENLATRIEAVHKRVGRHVLTEREMVQEFHESPPGR